MGMATTFRLQIARRRRILASRSDAGWRGVERRADHCVCGERERDDNILQSQARPLPLVTRVTQRTPVNEPNMNMTHLERDSPVLLEARLQLEEGVDIPEQPRWDSRPSP
jgi:hypothetical protein